MPSRDLCKPVLASSLAVVLSDIFQHDELSVVVGAGNVVCSE